MNGSFVVSLVWLLAMVGAVAHGSRKVVGPTDVAQMAVAFAVAFGLAVLVTPQPGWVGFLVTVLAVWRLIDGGATTVDRVLGGACAGLAGALFAAFGLNLWLSCGLAAVVFAAGVAMARTPRADGSKGRDITLPMVALGGAVASLAPQVASGWQSARTLNQAAIKAGAPAIPTWAMAAVGLALLGGLARGILRRR